MSADPVGPLDIIQYIVCGVISFTLKNVRPAVWLVIPAGIANADENSKVFPAIMAVPI